MATPRGRQGYSRRKSRALVQATHQQTEDVNPKDFVRIAPVPSEHYPMSEVKQKKLLVGEHKTV